MKNPKVILSLVLLGLLIVFVIQNAEVLNVNFLFWSFAMSRALTLFFVLAIGIVIGWVLHGLRRARR